MVNSENNGFGSNQNQFFRISLKEWKKGNSDESYSKIQIPTRKTSGSAGYDIVSPHDIRIAPGGTAIVQTGLKCNVNKGEVLMIYPRSSIGFKYGIYLMNTVGVIDADYFDNESNEGHIMIGLRNASDKEVVLSAGDRIAQGIFMKFGTTVDDTADGARIGGFGSTGK